MTLGEIFAEFIKKENLSHQKILLLISGGVDSMVLLDIASKICNPKDLEVLHFDHNLRKNSVQDFMLIEKICTEKNIPLHRENILLNNKSDQENQWRKIRKKISRDLADSIGAAKILTAHHATDLVETMIFRLTKGCGPNGLSPFEINTKPFWQIPKIELITYAKANKLKWNEDMTNKEIVHERNLIRHNVIPELRKITPNLEQVFVRESKIFAGISDYLAQEVRQKADKKSISLEKFLKLPLALQTELLREISQKITSTSEINDCLKWLKNEPDGNSQKFIGGTELSLIKGEIIW